jgi:hypothetical protein
MSLLVAAGEPDCTRSPLRNTGDILERHIARLERSFGRNNLSLHIAHTLRVTSAKARTDYGLCMS